MTAAPIAADPERALAMSYAPRGTAPALAALLGLDAALGGILRTTREPLLGQMRLTWWFDALVALDAAPPPPEPVLQALAAEVLPRGVSGAALAAMIEGWEALLDPDPLDAARIAGHARGRGSTLFALAGRVACAASGDPLAAAGAGWALADLGAHLRDPAAAAVAHGSAAQHLAIALRRRWSRNGRALGALALIARMDLASGADRPRPSGAPTRVARLALHRLLGR